MGTDSNLYVGIVAQQEKSTLWRESSGVRDGRVWCDDAEDRPSAVAKGSYVLPRS